MTNFSFDEALAQNNPTDDSICDVILQAVKLRNYQNLSRKELADKAKITEEDVLNFEMMKLNSISLDIFSKILSALDVRIQPN